jgi:8-oxo-dGTP pyrophosphatase MutT (NUDIX family)
MANSSLINKKVYYKIPQNIVDEITVNMIKNKTVQSTKKQKIKNFIKNPYLSYHSLKRLKNILETLQTNNEEVSKNDFFLLGGNTMLGWVNNILDSLRNSINSKKSIRKNIADFNNQYRKPHTKSFVKAPQFVNPKHMIPDLKPQTIVEEESNVDNIIKSKSPIKIQKGSVCLIFNEENRLLLLKRRDDDHWMPSKYSLVGGMANDNESRLNCILREVKEETSLILKNPKFCFDIIENDNLISVFIDRTQNNKIVLDEENTDYKWCTFQDLSKMDLVPNIYYIILMLSKKNKK